MSLIKQFKSITFIVLLLLSFSVSAALTSPGLDAASIISDAAAKDNALAAQWLAYSQHTGSPSAWNSAELTGADFDSNSARALPITNTKFEKRGKTTVTIASEFNGGAEVAGMDKDSFAALYMWPSAEGGVSIGIALTIAVAAWLLFSTLAVVMLAKRYKKNNPHILVTINK
ncbi:MAG: hypothetical protein KJP25_04955 [Gammaproteobacteria bacterium]|nr:hypothetical protein [Gammaproteobacteria bacterium]NND39604.1 hypothetical protein [Pseudomonadales bacterium]MBT8151580.1 hypothetical protein [Gammaproteobacteria bacterium]NNL10320.1 hypothetical protein [Pseudomonadales bacterium]NNM11509.1 hypothetical protein [Pseudomonadales bacterium]